MGSVGAIVQFNTWRDVYEVDIPNDISDTSLPFWAHELRLATDAEALAWRLTK